MCVESEYFLTKGCGEPFLGFVQRLEVYILYEAVRGVSESTCRPESVTYEVESWGLKKPPVLLKQFLSVVLSLQYSLDAKDVWFCCNDGHRLWFCAGVPSPMKDPYWKTGES